MEAQVVRTDTGWKSTEYVVEVLQEDGQTKELHIRYHDVEYLHGKLTAEVPFMPLSLHLRYKLLQGISLPSMPRKHSVFSNTSEASRFVVFKLTLVLHPGAGHSQGTDGSFQSGMTRH